MTGFTNLTKISIEKGLLKLEFEGNVLFYVLAFEDGVLTIRFNPLRDLDEIAQVVVGCFEADSVFRNIKAVQFAWCGINVMVTPENANVSAIKSLWREKLRKFF